MTTPSPQPDVWVSVETVLGPVAVEDGLLKQRREPVLALVSPRLNGRHLSCDWLFTHPGLVPGPYELVGGITVHIPPARCSESGVAAHSVTLEVK